MADLTTLATVKSWLKVTTATDDSLLQTLITNCSAMIEAWLSRTISPATYTEIRNGHNGTTLLFENYPVTAVSSVKINNQTVPAAADCCSAGYSFDDQACYLLAGGIFPRGIRNVIINYTAGYTATPAAISEVCMELVGKKYRERDRIGVNSKTLAGEVVTFSASDLTDEIKSMLRSFQKVVPT